MTNTNISDLYEHTKTLIRQWTYLKSEIDSSLTSKADVNHNHASDDIIDSAAHTNLGTSANASQSTINSAINDRIGNVTQILVGTGE